MSEGRPKIRWARGFFRAWVVVSVVWVFSSVFIFHSEIKYKSTDHQLTIEGHDVVVGDEFQKLSPVQQNATVDEIAQSMGWHPLSGHPDTASAELPEGATLIPNDPGAPMARNIIVTLKGGGEHTYLNVPDDVTPGQIVARAKKDFSKDILNIVEWNIGTVSNAASLGGKSIVWGSVQFVAGLALIPPIIVFMLGIMTGWAISGFKRA